MVWAQTVLVEQFYLWRVKPHRSLGYSVSLLFTQDIYMFSHDIAHVYEEVECRVNCGKMFEVKKNNKYGIL